MRTATASPIKAGLYEAERDSGPSSENLVGGRFTCTSFRPEMPDRFHCELAQTVAVAVAKAIESIPRSPKYASPAAVISRIQALYNFSGADI